VYKIILSNFIFNSALIHCINIDVSTFFTKNRARFNSTKKTFARRNVRRYRMRIHAREFPTATSRCLRQTRVMIYVCKQGTLPFVRDISHHTFCDALLHSPLVNLSSQRSVRPWRIVRSLDLLRDVVDYPSKRDPRLEEGRRAAKHVCKKTKKKSLLRERRHSFRIFRSPTDPQVVSQE